MTDPLWELIKNCEVELAEAISIFGARSCREGLNAWPCPLSTGTPPLAGAHCGLPVEELPLWRRNCWRFQPS